MRQLFAICIIIFSTSVLASEPCPILVAKKHNAERQIRNIPLLKYNQDLFDNAQNHATWMAQSGSLRHQRLGKQGWRMMGENIAMGQRTEDQVMNGWMQSSGHRSNILNRGYEYIGVGIAKGNRGLFWCVVFGKK